MNVPDESADSEGSILRALDFTPDFDYLSTSEVDDSGLPEGEWAGPWLESLINSCIVNLKGSTQPYAVYQVYEHSANLFPEENSPFEFATELRKIALDHDSPGSTPSISTTMTRLGLLDDPTDKFGSVLATHTSLQPGEYDRERDHFILAVFTTANGRQYFGVTLDDDSMTEETEVFPMESLYSFRNRMLVPPTTGNLETIEYIANLHALSYHLPPMCSRTLREIMEDHMLEMLQKLGNSVVPVMSAGQRREYYQTLMRAAIPFIVASTSEMASLLFSNVNSLRSASAENSLDPTLLPKLIYSSQTPKSALNVLRDTEIASISGLQNASRAIASDLQELDWDSLRINRDSAALSKDSQEMLDLWGAYLLADTKFASKGHAEASAMYLVQILGYQGYRDLQALVKKEYGFEMWVPDIVPED